MYVVSAHDSTAWLTSEALVEVDVEAVASALGLIAGSGLEVPEATEFRFPREKLPLAREPPLPALELRVAVDDPLKLPPAILVPRMP